MQKTIFEGILKTSRQDLQLLLQRKDQVSFNTRLQTFFIYLSLRIRINL